MTSSIVPLTASGAEPAALEGVAWPSHHAVIDTTMIACQTCCITQLRLMKSFTVPAQARS